MALLLHLSPQHLWDGEQEAKHHGSGVTDKPQEKQAALRGARPASRARFGGRIEAPPARAPSGAGI